MRAKPTTTRQTIGKGMSVFCKVAYSTHGIEACTLAVAHNGAKRPQQTIQRKRGDPSSELAAITSLLIGTAGGKHSTSCRAATSRMRCKVQNFSSGFLRLRHEAIFSTDKPWRFMSFIPRSPTQQIRR